MATELEVTPIDLSPNWYALMFCILTRHDPEKVLDKALAKFELKDKPRPDTQPEDPAAAILSIITGGETSAPHGQGHSKRRSQP